MSIATSKQNTVSEKEALSVAALREVSDAQLVPLLFTAAHALRAASTASQSVSAEYVDVLLSPRFTKNGSADVRQLVGCLLCDVIRLGCHAGSRTSRQEQTLPFPTTRCDEVLRCVLFPFTEVIRTRGSLHQCALLIEAASAAHALAAIVPHCRQPDTPALLQSLFEAVDLANGGTTTTTTTTTTGAVRMSRAERHALSSTAASEMAQLLADVLAATGQLTTDQVAPLVRALAQTSSSLHRAALLTGLDSTKAKTAMTATAEEDSAGAMIASRLLVEHVDTIAPALTAYAMGLVEEGVQEVTAADLMASADATGAGPTASTAAANSVEKRAGLRHLANGLEVLVVMGELEPALVAELVPQLIPLLRHDAPDVRLLVFRGFSAALTASEAVFHAYQHALVSALLLGLQDAKPAVRVEVAQATSHWVDTAVRQSWTHSSLETLWSAMAPALERALTDPNVLVRRQVVMSVSHAALVVPAVAVLDSTPASATAAPAATAAASSSLAKSLGLRTADKNASVRRSAVACLCKLYREQLLSWIPDAVLNAVHAESGLYVIECYLEQLLPPPTKASTSPHSSDLLPTRTGTAANAQTAVFDFEKEALREERGFVEALVQLCTDVSPQHFTTLASLMRKKPQLRTAIARLFELRDEIKLKDDPKSPEGQTVIHNIHRLLEFLQGITHAEKGEWDTLFRSKDDRVSKAFLQVCTDDAQAQLVDWQRARTQLLDTLQGRLPTPAAGFVRETLAPMMMFPVQLAHLEELVSQLQTVLTSLESSSSTAATKQARQGRVLGMLRALHLLLLTAPGFLAYTSTSLLGLLTQTTESLRRCAPPPTSHAAARDSARPTTSEEETWQASFRTHSEWCLAVLACVREWTAYTAAAGDLADYATPRATGAATSTSSNTSSSSASTLTARAPHSARRHPLVGVTEATKKAALDTLACLCKGDLAALFFSPPTPTNPANRTGSRKRSAAAQAEAAPSATDATVDAVQTHAVLVLTARLSKEAARCFGGLLAIRDFGGAADLRALLEALTAHVCQAAQDTATPVPMAATACVRSACCLSALRAFLQDKSYASLLLGSGALETALHTLLLGAVRPTGAGTRKAGSVDDMKAKAFFATRAAAPMTATATTVSSHASTRASMELPFTAETLLLDKAAKALSAAVLGSAADRSPAALSGALDVMLQGYTCSCEGERATSSHTAPTPATPAQLGTIGACRTRLAIDKQLGKLLLTPSSELGKELAVSVLLSAETEACVREPIQRKLVSHVLRAGSRADMRYVALLLLTAVSEDSRHGFQQLRALVQTVGDHLRQRQSTSGASLSSPQALYCYMEYTIPFLVLFQAHHTYYESEGASHFLAYQRVWHLLFDELFRYGTQCTSFVSELLSRIKQSEDVLDRASDRHRVLCDVASRVMLACLSQRQTSVDAVKRYPGVVLLPNFFVKSSKQDSQTVLSTVYLDGDVRIFSSAPFRAPPTTTSTATSTRTSTTHGALAAEAFTAQTSPSVTPRTSVARAGTSRARGAVRLADEAQEGEDDDDDDEAMEAEERALTPYGALSATPASASRKRPSRSPSHGLSPAARSDLVKRGRTEPTPTAHTHAAAAASHTDTATKATDGTALARAAVEETLESIVRGLHKGAIASMRWKTVKARIEAAVDRVGGSSDADDEEARAALMDYAKELLKQHYTDAPV